MIVRFGVHEVDLRTVDIRRNGTPVPVQPQVFAVIEYLIDHRDRVVTKEELLDEIWGDRFVSESALTSRIKTARQALGDSGSAQRVIRTVQGRGYRFVAEVTIEDAREREVPAVVGPAVETIDPGRADLDGLASVWPLVGRADELAFVQQLLADSTVGGVLITGPEGIGAQRFADACQAQVERLGLPIARVIGLAQASNIPLAVMSHLLPADVLATGEAVDDLARAQVLRRARAVMEESLGGRRLVVVVQNADQLDPMTATLLAQLMLGGSVFALAVRARLAAPTTDASLRATLFREVALSRLSETEIDILLHRVLGGPLASAALRELVEMSEGRPGLLRDIVETSIGTGSLICDGGVWRLAGRLTSTAVRAWNPGDLSEHGRRAAEILALMARLPERIAVELLGDAGLEELDRHRLLVLEGSGDATTVVLADRLLAQAVHGSIGPLRERRLKRELVQRFLRPGTEPVALATVVPWAGESGDAIDHELILAAAQTAMLQGDMATAGLLAEHVTNNNDPAVQLIAAEVTLRHSQWARAESQFEAIDVDRLDETSRAHVLRRRAAIQFYSRSRFDETIDWVAEQAERYPGRTRQALLTRRVGMLAHQGRVHESLAAIAELPELHGLSGIEVLLSTGTAHFHRGRFREALSHVDRADQLLDRVPAAWADEPRDAILTMRCLALFQLGKIGQASDLIRASLPLGRRTPFGFLPSAAGSIELAAGRPRAAREHVRQAIESSHRDEFPQYLDIAEAVFAQTDLALGRHQQAAAGLARARHALDAASGELLWLLLIMIAQLASGLGESVDAARLAEAADEAQELGASMREADLLVVAALLDGSGKTASAHVDRVERLVAGFDGELWPIRAAHVRALADGADLSLFKVQYHDLGYDGLAV